MTEGNVAFFQMFVALKRASCGLALVSQPMSKEIKQDAQLSQRDPAAGCISFGEKWKTGTGRQ